MKKKRNQRGFTLAELLLAVAILIILMGIGFVAVNAYVKKLKQNEMNWVAKEIFISAQNQLSKANAGGTLAEVTAKGYSYEVAGAESGKNKKHTEYYAIVNTDSWDPAGLEEILLPFGSIDETVRAGGHYVIRYDYDSATVTQVYYSEEKECVFTDGDLGGKFAAGTLTDEERRSFPRGSKNCIIGFYDGSAEVLDTETVEAPTKFIVHNEERLYAEVTITDPNWRMLLCIKGVDSGAKTTMSPSDAEIVNAEFVLDDITSSGKHFSQQFLGDGFIPGEDLELYVTVQHRTALSNVAESNHVVTNSLFASKDTKEETDEVAGTTTTASTVRIEAFRHLENLDRSISGVDVTDGKKIDITTAEQNKDLNWNNFFSTSGLASPRYITNVEGNEIQYLKEKSYVPVNLNYDIEYKGNNRSISNIDIAVKEDSSLDSAGLFGTITSNATIKNLELRNVNFANSSGTATNAGALVGHGVTGSKLTVENVIAYNKETDKTKETSIEIRASVNAGGLIGNTVDADLTGCAAAVYVKSSTGNAGGLVGSLDSGSIKNSYFGAHTDNGDFKSPAAANNTAKGRINVYAGVFAGGIIGKNGAASISNSYSSGSVYSSSTETNHEGLLIGNNPNYKNTGCYGAGWMFEKNDKGEWKPVFPELYMKDFSGTMRQPAVYYDDFWAKDLYPYSAISEDNTVWFLYQHVGDWALPGYRADFIND